MKTVKDILIKKPSHFSSVDYNDKVIDAIALMAREDINYVIVEDRGKYIGIFSEKDYTRKVILAGKESKNTKVGDIMSANIPVVDVCDTTDTCAELMHAFKISFLPVFQDFDFIGVITLSDLLNDTVHEHQKMFDDKDKAATYSKERNNDNIPHYWAIE